MNATEKDNGFAAEQRIRTAQALCEDIARILDEARENGNQKLIAYLELALAEAEDRLRDLMP